MRRAVLGNWQTPRLWAGVRPWIRYSFLAGSLAAMVLASGCGSLVHQRQYRQTFSCDQWYDGWAHHADLLEYSYGDTDPMLTHRKPLPGYTSMGCGGVTTTAPVAEFFDIKWRLVETGEVIEKHVDLRGRLPANMDQQEVTFVIDHRDLYMYLVTPQKATPPAKQTHRTWLSKHNVTYEIYPHNEYKKMERAQWERQQ